MSIKLAEKIELDNTQMREVYSGHIVRMIEAGEPVMVLDADLMRPVGILPYRDKYPENIIDCGIAEANMIGVACGLSAEGFIPFTHSFATFASRRVMDQVFMSGAYAGQNVKMVGSDPGVCAALNGGTHMAFEDAAMMRAVPEMTIIEPTDTVMLDDLMPKIAHTRGMMYIRLCRMEVERIYAPGSSFEIGKAAQLRDGSDVTIIAAGREVVEALRAADMLKDRGVSARVLDMFTIKPIDAEAVEAAARETGAIVTAENHNIIGGLGSAVMEVTAGTMPVPVERIGAKDCFGVVGKTDYLMRRFELTAEHIVGAALRAIERKNRG